ncbi:flavoprotein [Paraburkholderia sp. JHI869]|uniref:flavoprotein n=1 Tax=Paraburkholderia sp. JHI869 TaxID=3112959 RepID=UPI00317CDD03
MSKRALNGRKRLIVGVTGATGFIYAERTLRLLREMEVETHLVISRAAELTRGYESSLSREAREPAGNGRSFGEPRARPVRARYGTHRGRARRMKPHGHTALTLATIGERASQY